MRPASVRASRLKLWLIGVLAIATAAALGLYAGRDFVPALGLSALAQRGAAAAIFVSSYVALAIGRMPGLPLDRAGTALVGAA